MKVGQANPNGAAFNAADSAACTKDAQCLGSSVCDASAGCTGANLRTMCNPVTGLDSVQCYGRCTPFCNVSAVVAETALYNRGVCSGANDASCGTGFACAAKATCQQVSSCNSTTRALSFSSCYGYCRPSAGAAALSGQLSDDGTEILVTLNLACQLLGNSAAAVFDRDTTRTLGAGAYVYMDAVNASIMHVALSPGATIGLAGRLGIQQSNPPPLVDSLLNTAVLNGNAPNNPQPPLAMISGPNRLGAACAGASAIGITFDGRASPPSSNRQLTS
ncbi:hypothetical protein WJX81_007578 [Elliptochloris bilobata]|uniref:Uncharacterized protein n=1 Tax=Elliptochloris bilobata TaxID=381761 RepID=A0AAW1RHX5_9CHLO